MATTKETLLDWLRDAHAMESSIISLLERQSGSLEGHPALEGKINEHLEITRQQKEKVGQLIERLGGDTSAVKEGTGKLLSNLKAMSTAAASDMVVKDSIANFAVEHFEIASYKSLIAAAQDLGESEVEQTCREILRQEEEMAEWLDEHISQVTKVYLQQEAKPQA